MSCIVSYVMFTTQRARKMPVHTFFPIPTSFLILSQINPEGVTCCPQGCLSAPFCPRETFRGYPLPVGCCLSESGVSPLGRSITKPCRPEDTQCAPCRLAKLHSPQFISVAQSDFVTPWTSAGQARAQQTSRAWWLPAISPSSLLTYLVLSEKLRPQKPSLTHHWVQPERNFC